MSDPRYGTCDHDASEAAYTAHVIGNRPSCALGLLTLWDRPWSSRALRFAYHALHLALSRGLDVLETRIPCEDEYFAAHDCPMCDPIEHCSHSE